MEKMMEFQQPLFLFHRAYCILRNETKRNETKRNQTKRIFKVVDKSKIKIKIKCYSRYLFNVQVESNQKLLFQVPQ